MSEIILHCRFNSVALNFKWNYNNISANKCTAEMQPEVNSRKVFTLLMPCYNNQYHCKPFFFPSRWSRLEGSLRDPCLPASRSWGLLWQRILPMFWGRRDPSWPSVAVWSLARPFWSQTSVGWHRAPLWHCNTEDWKSHRRASQDTDSSPRAALLVQRGVEAVAAAVLWDVPVLLVW